ncbi:MAG TPA: TetR/AcrR family transcriptional regulator [Kaistia sp.]|nr:TetR/AcrR family transcriptional regulator [Kaistia sp.]
MARPKEFEKAAALEAAIGVFREHGFAHTSASMLTDAMKIGRQSLYDTFGDKWQLYCAAVDQYGLDERAAHLAALETGPRAIDGVARMIERIVAEARRPCLGVGSTSEFGDGQADLNAIRDRHGRVLRDAIAARIRAARTAGDMPSDVDPEEAAGFLLASIAAVRLAARGGASDAELASIGRMALRALT